MIDTKFNLGDEVITKFKGVPRKAIITGIFIKASVEGPIKERYELVFKDPEEAGFSKDSRIKALRAARLITPIK